GRPWLVLRGAEHEAVLWNGPVLELDRPLRRGADILDERPDYERMAANLRSRPERQIGDALLDQRLVMGIGNIWRSEALWDARVSPWRSISSVSDTELSQILESAHRLMASSVEGARPLRRVYRRAGRACRRCGTPIRAHAQATAPASPIGAPPVREEAASRRRKQQVQMRSPHLYETLRRFCLGSFAVFHGEDLPFAFEEHAPSFYEYRPLVKSFIEGQAERLRPRQDVQAALADLAREPAVRMYTDPFRAILVPLLVGVAEGCGGFDWDDSAFDRSYEEMEARVFGDGHSYGAVAPLVGISCGTAIELGGGLRVRAAATGEFAALWPESSGLLPRDFGREVDRLCVLELERSL